MQAHLPFAVAKFTETSHETQVICLAGVAVPFQRIIRSFEKRVGQLIETDVTP